MWRDQYEAAEIERSRLQIKLDEATESLKSYTDPDEKTIYDGSMIVLNDDAAINDDAALIALGIEPLQLQHPYAPNTNNSNTNTATSLTTSIPNPTHPTTQLTNIPLHNKTRQHNAQLIEENKKLTLQLTRTKQFSEARSTDIASLTDEFQTALRKATSLSQINDKLKNQLQSHTTLINKLRLREANFQKSAEEAKFLSESTLKKAELIYSKAAKTRLLKRRPLIRTQQLIHNFSQNFNNMRHNIKNDVRKAMKGIGFIIEEGLMTLEGGEYGFGTDDMQRRYREVVLDRQRLQNKILEMQGNIRVFAKVRPISSELASSDSNDTGKSVIRVDSCTSYGSSLKLVNPQQTYFSGVSESEQRTNPPTHISHQTVTNPRTLTPAPTSRRKMKKHTSLTKSLRPLMTPTRN